LIFASSILAKINNREMANAFLEAFDGFGFMTDLNDIQKSRCIAVVFYSNKYKY
jgi:hypothetical protein